MNMFIRTTVVLFVTVLVTRVAFSHCEIPCGIYDAELRSQMIEEHIATIEKAMTKLMELTAKNNQVVRWIDAKDRHAQNIQDIPGIL